MHVMQELKRRQKAILKEFRAREKKGKQLLRKIAAHEKAVETLKNELSALFDQNGAAPTTVAKPVLSNESGKARRMVAHREGPTQRERVKAILEKSGRAMSISEIGEALQADGYPSKAKKPIAALTVLLYTNKRFFKKVTPGCFAMVCPIGSSKVDVNNGSANYDGTTGGNSLAESQAGGKWP